MKARIGRVLIILVIVSTMLIPVLFWLDDVHLINDDWPLHAKYHLIWQGMLLILFNLAALYLAISQWHSHRLVALISAAVPTITWLAFLLSAYLIVPLFGFEAANVFPHHHIVNGIDMENLGVIFTLLIPIVGYWLSQSGR